MQKITSDIDLFVKKLDSENLIDKAKTACCWDFNTAMGNTLAQKYESLYVKIVEISQYMVKNGAQGYFWIICPPTINTLFEHKLHTNHKHEYYPMGTLEKQYVGILEKKWMVYTDVKMFVNKLAIGCNSDTDNIGVIHCANYIL